MFRSPRRLDYVYVNNYVEFVFLLLRGPYVRLVYLLNMLSSLNKDIIIIIILLYYYYYIIYLTS